MKRDPINAAELRLFCIALLNWILVGREILLSRTPLGRSVLLGEAEHDFTPQIQVVRQLLARIAGTASRPRFKKSPYPRIEAVETLYRVLEWCCDPRNRLLRATTSRDHTRPRNCVKQANDTAMALAEADPGFLSKPLRGWAEAIGCSDGLVNKLPLWQETMEQTGRGKRDKASAPKVISLTENLDAISAEGTRDEILGRLADEEEACLNVGRKWDTLSPEERQEILAEQQADDDQADSGPKKIRTRRRL
jgi:hypothetical protein